MLCCSVLLAAMVSAQDEPAVSTQTETSPPAQVEQQIPTPVNATVQAPRNLQTPTASDAAAPAPALPAQLVDVPSAPVGDARRGRLVFGACRTCHYAEESMGYNNGPNLHRIFGKVAGKQEGFNYYSDEFKAAKFVWTPAVMYVWLENPMAMFPTSTMMSLGVPDPQERADLIEFLKQASEREP
jgi:cytochrome c